MEKTQRISELLSQMRLALYRRTDILFARLMMAQWAFAILYSAFLSPFTWEGNHRFIHPHIWVALGLGGILTFISLYMVMMHSGTGFARQIIAVNQMLMSSLLIHLMDGRVEAHFHVFGSLAFLAFYRDWRVLVTSSLVVAFDHILRGSFWPYSVFGTATVSHWRWMEHAAWVAFENVFLVAASIRSQREMYQIAEKQTDMEILNKNIEKAIQERTDELTKTQKQLVESQKLEAIGQLASGVAHDFNNMLGGILAYSSLLKEDYAHDPVLSGALETIETSAERGAELTQKLLAFARKGNYEFKKVCLQNIVSETLDLLEPSFKRKIQILVSYGNDLWPTEGDPTQIFQVVMNLAVNAKDAMPNGGTLRISAMNVEVDENYLKVHKTLTLGEYVRLSIEDNGSGMSKEVQQKIFEPFFTTKAPGAGTGLGLPMVYGIMKSHKGAVCVYSEEGQGTVFHLYFPKSEIKAEYEVEEARTISRNHFAGKKVLIVDDEPNIRKVGSEIFRRYGAEVRVAETGLGAVRLVKDKADFDIVVLDVVMPDMNGTEAFHEIRQFMPEAHFIFASGYAESGDITELVNTYGVHFVQKPFKGETLVRAAARKKLAA